MNCIDSLRMIGLLALVGCTDRGKIDPSETDAALDTEETGETEDTNETGDSDEDSGETDVEDTEDSGETDALDTDDSDLPIDTDLPDEDGDGVPVNLDCDDQDPEVGTMPPTYPDADGDTFGDPNLGIPACLAPEEYIEDHQDCDDADPLIHPDGIEICNDKDDDCNALVDDHPPSGTPHHPDADGDTYGDSGTIVLACGEGPGIVLDASDCDDKKSWVHPNAAETCDGIDSACDGQTEIMHSGPDIQQSIDLAVDGDEVCIPFGIYVTKFYWQDKGIHVMAADPSNRPVMRPNGAPTGPMIAFNGDSTSIVEGFVIDDFSSSVYSAITMQGSGKLVDVDLTDIAAESAVLVDSNSEAMLERVRLERIDATASVGAGWVLLDSFAVCTDCEFIDVTGDIGAAAYLSGSEAIFVDSKFQNIEGTMGAAIYVDNSDLTLESSQGENVESTFGAVYVTQGSLASTACEWSDSYSLNGGGAYFLASSALISAGDRFIGNHASEGGAVRSESHSELTFSGSVFVSNAAADEGGGVWASGGDVWVEQSTFAWNEAEEGSAYFSTDGADLDLLQSLFAANRASGLGAALAFDAGSGGFADIWNSMFLDNVGGEAVTALDAGPSSVQFRYNLLFRNSSNTLSIPSSGIVIADPLLALYAPLVEGSALFPYAKTGSPAINAGNPSVLDVDGSISDLGPFGGLGALAQRTDSDSDGLPDDYELAWWGTLSKTGGQDSDADSRTNLQEYNNGTHPAVGDTDGDGFLDGADASPLNPAVH